MLFVAVLGCSMRVLLKHAALSARPKEVLTWGIVRIYPYDANRIYPARTAHVLVHNMYFDNPFSHNMVTATKKCMLTSAYDQNSGQMNWNLRILMYLCKVTTLSVLTGFGGARVFYTHSCCLHAFCNTTLIKISKWHNLLVKWAEQGMLNYCLHRSWMW